MQNRDDIFVLIKENQLEQIKLLFKNKSKDEKHDLLKKKGTKQHEGYVLNSFEYALLQDNLDVFKELLSHVDPRHEEHDDMCARALLLAVMMRKWQPFEMMLDKYTQKITLTVRWIANENNIVHSMVESNNLEMLKLLLPKYHIKILTKKNKQDQSPIVLAATLGHFTLVQALLAYLLENCKTKNKIDSDLLDDADCIAILKCAYAAKTNEREIIKAIFAHHQFKCNVASLPWSLFLSLAIENECWEQVQGIIKAVTGNNLKTDLLTSKNGKTVLDWVCENKQWEIAELFLKNIKILAGENSSKRNHNLALQYAMQHGHYLMAELLLKDGYVKINQVHIEHGNVFLYHAILNNRADLVELLLNYKADLSQKNSQGQTALELARSLGYGDCVNVLENAQAKKQTGILSTVTSLFKTITKSKKPENMTVLTDTQKMQIENSMLTQSIFVNHQHPLFLTQSKFIANRTFQNDGSDIKLEPVYEGKQLEGATELLDCSIRNYRQSC